MHCFAGGRHILIRQAQYGLSFSASFLSPSFPYLSVVYCCRIYFAIVECRTLLERADCRRQTALFGRLRVEKETIYLWGSFGTERKRILFLVFQLEAADCFLQHLCAYSRVLLKGQFLKKQSVLPFSLLVALVD